MSKKTPDPSLYGWNFADRTTPSISLRAAALPAGTHMQEIKGVRFLFGNKRNKRGSVFKANLSMAFWPPLPQGKLGKQSNLTPFYFS